MEVHEGETREVIKLFLSRKLSLTACIAALDSALEDLIPRLTADQATRLRIAMLSNNEIVMNEMDRRAVWPHSFRGRGLKVTSMVLLAVLAATVHVSHHGSGWGIRASISLHPGVDKVKSQGPLR